jgi:hypothetical protein
MNEERRKKGTKERRNKNEGIKRAGRRRKGQEVEKWREKRERRGRGEERKKKRRRTTYLKCRYSTDSSGSPSRQTPPRESSVSKSGSLKIWDLARV